jgi:hypothetical protein
MLQACGEHQADGLPPYWHTLVGTGSCEPATPVSPEYLPVEPMGHPEARPWREGEEVPG